MLVPAKPNQGAGSTAIVIALRSTANDRLYTLANAFSQDMASLMRTLIVGLTLLLSTAPSVNAQEPVYWDVVEQIKDEAFENSQVMENASWLVDVFAPRNTKSPGYIAAAKWAKERLQAYGLANARLEPYRFGVGYVNEYVSVHMISPQYMPIIAYPATWSAGTNGKIRGRAVYINFDEIYSTTDLEPYRGKLNNAVIMTTPKRKLAPQFEAPATRFTKEQLDEMAKLPFDPLAADEIKPHPREGKLPLRQIIEFVFDEGAAVIVRTDDRSDFGTVVVENTRYTLDNRLWEKDAPRRATELVMAAEHYNRIMRIIEKDIPVEIEVELKVSFSNDDLRDFNVVAEISGTDLADEIVLLGSHLQANPAGGGAADDAAGVVVCMEVVRIFKALGLVPRRTIRIGLWGGHEMGVFGNKSHVRKNFADPKKREYKEDYNNLSAYFNLDHGNGRIRAVSIQGNENLRAIFTEWIKPLRSLGMTHLLASGMVHEAYQEVGLPSFYFVQDRMDSRQYHSNMDAYDRLVAEDLMANTVILATFVYHAAMRDAVLPRFAPLPW